MSQQPQMVGLGIPASDGNARAVDNVASSLQQMRAGEAQSQAMLVNQHQFRQSNPAAGQQQQQ